MDDACIFSLGPWEGDNLLIEFAKKENWFGFEHIASEMLQDTQLEMSVWGLGDRLV